MKIKRPHKISAFFKGSIVSALALILQAVPSYADDKKADKPVEMDPAKRLESVLKQAGQQGLVQVEGVTPIERVPDTPERIRSRAMLAFLEGQADCTATRIFDLADYRDETSFDKVLKIKSSAVQYKTIDDLLPLAKTYVALGLGAEPVALAEPFNTPEAYLLSAFARTIEEDATDVDRRVIQKYASCNEVSNFWNLVSMASAGEEYTGTGGFNITLNQLQILEDQPEHLENIVTARLGIYAAEQGATHLAEQLFLKIEPKAKNAKLPENKSDERLYFYGLIRHLKGDSKAGQVFNHLGQRDGKYRTRALHRLVKANADEGAELYESFSDDLLSIRQQYNGQSEGREATVEIVRQDLKNDKYVSSVELVKAELAPTTPERLNAVTIIGDRIYERLGSENKSARLFALNGYMHDTAFFEPHPRTNDLRVAAYDSAIALHLPELAVQVTPPAETKDNEPNIRKQKAFAKAKIALKENDYDAVSSIAGPYKADEKFEKLLLAAAVAIADEKETARILTAKPEAGKHFDKQAQVAWRNSEWDAAKTALEAASKDDAGLETKIAVAEYVGQSRTNTATNTLKTADDLDVFNQQLSGDIALVKAYLTNG